MEINLSKTILLVEDQDESRITTKWFLTSFGYTVESVRSAEEALALFDPKVHDLVLTDNSMPQMSGMEMAHVIKLRSPTTPVLMYTGRAPDNRSCLDLVLEKPAPMLTLKDAVSAVLAARRMSEIRQPHGSALPPPDPETRAS